ncbi:helix-turn-helix domain-containing protein [Streptomyces sp. NPDC050625]|uniref:PucR family transcriptional regulator n=1 Tax=Streptomyces sp. NPDC050625 TaxID=3154629 RepID=UPI003441BB89
MTSPYAPLPRGGPQGSEPETTEAISPVIQDLADVLLARLPELVEEVVDLILQEEPPYRPGDPITRADLTKVAGGNIERVLQVFAGRMPQAPSLYEGAQATGRLRAEQGFPLEAVLHGFRLGVERLWEKLLIEARARSPEVSEELLDNAVRLWRIVDLASTSFARGYRNREKELARRDEQRQDALLDALLEGHGVEPAVAAEAERVLGLPRDGRYAVVCVGHDPTQEHMASHSLRDNLAAWRIRSIWRVRLDREIGVVALARTPLSRVTTLLSQWLDQPAGISGEATGLAYIGTAAGLADIALRTAPPGEAQAFALDTRLPEALLVSAPDLAARLEWRMLGRVLDLEADERQTLLATLDSWFRSGRSAAGTAEMMHCHRNTVFNRLRRIQELTGYSLDNDRDELAYRLALAAVHTLPGRGTAQQP